MNKETSNVKYQTFEQFKIENRLEGPLDRLGGTEQTPGISKLDLRRSAKQSAARFEKYKAGVKEFQRKVNAGEIIDPTGEFRPKLPVDPNIEEIARLERIASELEELALRGMKLRTYKAHAAKLRLQAKELKQMAKKNPGEEWHRVKQVAFRSAKEISERPVDKAFYHGMEVAHSESRIASRRRQMPNPHAGSKKNPGEAYHIRSRKKALERADRAEDTGNIRDFNFWDGVHAAHTTSAQESHDLHMPNPHAGRGKGYYLEAQIGKAWKYLDTFDTVAAAKRVLDKLMPQYRVPMRVRRVANPTHPNPSLEQHKQDYIRSILAMKDYQKQGFRTAADDIYRSLLGIRNHLITTGVPVRTIDLWEGKASQSANPFRPRLTPYKGEKLERRNPPASKTANPKPLDPTAQAVRKALTARGLVVKRVRTVSFSDLAKGGAFNAEVEVTPGAEYLRAREIAREETERLPQGYKILVEIAGWTGAMNPFAYGPTGYRPPKKWWDKVYSGAKSSYKKPAGMSVSEYKEHLARIVGGMWSRFTDSTRDSILKKYEA